MVYNEKLEFRKRASGPLVACEPKPEKETRGSGSKLLNKVTT